MQTTETFRVRGRIRAVVLALVAAAVVLPLLMGDYRPAVRIGALVVLVAVALIVAERLTRSVVVTDGDLVVGRFFTRRRVSLRTLASLRGEVVRSGGGTQQSDFARFHLADAGGRTMSVLTHAVTDGRRLTATLARAADDNRLALDPQTESLLRFEAGGGIGGIFKDTARAIWNAKK
jgi:hypothetical protein